MARIRPLVIIPGILSLIAFVLKILLAIAGSHKGLLESIPLMTLNTSMVGQNLISITAADSSDTSSSSSSSSTTKTSSSTSSTSTTTNPLDALTSLIPTVTLADPLTSLIPTSNPLATILSSSSIDSEIETAINNAGVSIVHDLGLEQWYSFYVRDVCQGSYSPDATDPNAKKETALCKSTSKILNLTAIPSSLDLLGTNVSVPAIGIITNLSHKTKSEVNVLLTAVFALLIIGAISSGIVTLATPFMFFVPTSPLPHSSSAKLIFYPAFFSAEIGATLIIIAAITATAGEKAIKSELQSLEPLGIVVQTSSKFLAILWVSAVFSLLTSLYYGSVYWREFRTWTIGKREIGSEGEKKELLTTANVAERPPVVRRPVSASRVA